MSLRELENELSIQCSSVVESLDALCHLSSTISEDFAQSCQEHKLNLENARLLRRQLCGSIEEDSKESDIKLQSLKASLNSMRHERVASHVLTRDAIVQAHRVAQSQAYNWNAHRAVNARLRGLPIRTDANLIDVPSYHNGEVEAMKRRLKTRIARKISSQLQIPRAPVVPVKLGSLRKAAVILPKELPKSEKRSSDGSSFGEEELLRDYRVMTARPSNWKANGGDDLMSIEDAQCAPIVNDDFESVDCSEEEGSCCNEQEHSLACCDLYLPGERLYYPDLDNDNIDANKRCNLSQSNLQLIVSSENEGNRSLPSDVDNKESNEVVVTVGDRPVVTKKVERKRGVHEAEKRNASSRVVLLEMIRLMAMQQSDDVARSSELLYQYLVENPV